MDRFSKADTNSKYRAGLMYGDAGDTTPEDYRIVFMESGSRCEWCGREVSYPHFHYDHIMPLCRGGKNTKSNIALSCIPCNQIKGYKFPIVFALQQKAKGISTRLIDRIIAEKNFEGRVQLTLPMYSVIEVKKAA